MPEQPKIQLVTRGRYAILFSKWFFCFMLGMECGILGIGLLLFELYLVVVGIAIHYGTPIEIEIPWHGPLVFLHILLALLGGTLIFASRKMFVKTQSGVPFTPITSENTHLLPPAESLVRAAMPGPQSQQAELLRAAPGEQTSTPQDQLLRATPSPPETNVLQHETGLHQPRNE